MAGKSDYLEAAVLDHILGGPDFERPETVYVALFCTLPNDAGGGTEVASGVGYARVAVANDDTNFPAATGAGKKNGTAVTYPTATGSWGTVVGFGLFDALTGGNLLYWGGLTVSKTVAINDTPSFAANSLVITED